MLTKEQRNKFIKGSLRVERDSRDLSQVQLGEKIGTNPSTICAWEGKGGSISLDDAWAIADVYGISLDQLAGRVFVEV